MIKTLFPQNRLTLTGMDDDMLRYRCAPNDALKLIFPKMKTAIPDIGITQQHPAWRLGIYGPQKTTLVDRAIPDSADDSHCHLDS